LSIRGTLETFNLCELLQMLAFNRKVGTLVLRSEAGNRTIYLTAGEVTLAEQDPHLHVALLRLARHHDAADGPMLEKALARREEAGGNLAEILQEMRRIDEATRDAWIAEAVIDQLFEAQLTSVASFEFVEGEAALLPDGTEGTPANPTQSVDSVLLELARRLDQWNAACEVVPSPREVLEGTGIAVDLSELDDVGQDLADCVVPLIDGQRSLQDLASETHATLYAVMRIAAALFEAGGLRAVPTRDLLVRAEDLLARGEGTAALSMLRRAIERGDAPAEARLRLADALEAAGDREGAAAEFDTFAALSSEDDAPVVFEALSRALTLRDGDLATAMRVCDFYLRRRPWLREYRSHVSGALRDLIQGATQAQRPLDAAHRLAGFIQCGDAPNDDLVLLSDLYLAGGEKADAASALVRGAEDHLDLERSEQARDLLRRAVKIDPHHADARRHIRGLEGVTRRRLHKTRMALLVVLLLAVLGGAGITFFDYQSKAGREIGAARTEAEGALESSEQEAKVLIASFEKDVAGRATAEEMDPELGRRAEDLRREVRAVMSRCQRAIAAYGIEIDAFAASREQENHRSYFRTLEQRRYAMNTEATALVRGLTKRARLGLERGRTLNAKGEFEAARRDLLVARNLSFKDEETRAVATQLLHNVDAYFETFGAYEQEMQAATEKGDLAAAFRIGAAALQELMDSDLTKRLPFPVRVTSEPTGAQVWLGSRDTGRKTPCVATYSPFDAEPWVMMRMPGHTSSRTDLPDYDQIVDRPESLGDFVPAVAQSLAPGPRWTVQDKGGGFVAMWRSGDVPVVVGSGGYRVYSVSTADGTLSLGERLAPGNVPIRMGGVLDGGVRWHVRGQRTVSVRAGASEPWPEHAVGRIERRPAVADGRFVFIDELGTIYAHDVRDGTMRWTRDLSERPSQAPLTSALGVLVATGSGAAYRVDAGTGDVIPLAPAARSTALALPFGDGAVFLGGGRGGLRYVGPDGKVEVLGDAAPMPDRPPCVTAEGVAWIERDGVRWLPIRERRPVRLTGLGTQVLTLGSDGRSIVAGCADGILRGTDLGASPGAAWQMRLPGTVASRPLVIGRTAYVLVEGQLVAVEI
jgi:tetratricopeptide (TPR) repeat protein